MSTYYIMTGWIGPLPLNLIVLNPARHFFSYIRKIIQLAYGTSMVLLVCNNAWKGFIHRHLTQIQYTLLYSLYTIYNSLYSIYWICVKCLWFHPLVNAVNYTLACARDADCSLRFPLPSMDRLNQTEPSTYSVSVSTLYSLYCIMLDFHDLSLHMYYNL